MSQTETDLSVRLARSLRSHGIVALGCLLSVCYALNRGPDMNFDLRNIRAFNAWMIIRGRLSDDPVSNLLTQYLPLHDITNVILIGTGKWWIPVVFWGGVHASTIVISYRLIVMLAPSAPNIAKQLVAVTTLASPLIMMEIGTSFGDLTAAPFVGMMLLVCLQRKSQWNWWAAGAFLALAAVMKPTVLLSAPAVLIGVGLLACSVVQIATFSIGFIGIYFSLGLLWSLYWSHASGTTYLSIPGLPISGGRFVTVTLLAFGLLISLSVRRAAAFLSAADMMTARRRILWSVRALLAVAVVYQGNKWHRQFLVSGDTDWLVRSGADFGRRLFHIGSLKDGYRPLDLEMSYHDFRVPIAMATLIFAVVVSVVRLSRGDHEKFREVFGATTAIVAPIVFMIWILGYARYFIQFLPFVPVVLLAIACNALAIRARPTRVSTSAIVVALVLSASVAALVPVANGSPFVKRFAQTGAQSSLLSRNEAETLNSLIPKGVTVHIAGILVSSAAVFLNRSDVRWTYEIPTKAELESSRHMVLYSPQWQKAMLGLRESGAKTRDCVVLRFRFAIYGICDLSA